MSSQPGMNVVMKIVLLVLAVAMLFFIAVQILGGGNDGVPMAPGPLPHPTKASPTVTII